MIVASVFAQCVSAIRGGSLIVRESSRDKEFHFQNWFKERLIQVGINFDQSGRNSYPDFALVQSAEGYELKGLAYPGRDASFDSNSQVPTGFHNGRTIYYAFGRYPSNPDGDRYPVLDLVVCHGDFLNADHGYHHMNRSLRGFGSYGDILIRDRKMYVVPTPFRLADGLAHQHTLILPANDEPGSDFFEVGELKRIEAQQMTVGYVFDLRTNELTTQKMPNPAAGTEHVFRAWRLHGSSTEQVSMRPTALAPVRGDTDDE